MQIDIEQHSDQRAVISLAGRLDVNSADALKAALSDAVGNGLIRLVIDMQRVSFVDSSGLSAMVSGFKAVRVENGALALANLGAQIRVALQLTRLDRVFSIYENVTEALASFDKETNAS